MSPQDPHKKPGFWGYRSTVHMVHDWLNMSRPSQRRFPLEPLTALVGPLTIEQAARDDGRNIGGQLGYAATYDQDAPIRVMARRFRVSRRTVLRWALLGIPEEAADRAACELGFHPVSIWHDWFEGVEEA